MAEAALAVLGERACVLGFRALGLDVFPVETEEACRATLRRLLLGPYQILCLSESFAPVLTQELSRRQDQPGPAVLLIPGRGGSLDLGRQSLTAALERAVGADIL